MVDRNHPSSSIVRQGTLLGVSRTALYYRSKGISADDLFLMRKIYRQYLETPLYGSRRPRAWLGRQGMVVSRKRVQRLMRTMRLRSIYRGPRTSRPAPGYRIYPNLLENANIVQPGVGRRHHLPAPGPRISLPGDHHGLAQPLRWIQSFGQDRGGIKR